MDYPRDLVGYGENPPDPEWLGDSRLALQFVLYYEEGAEASVLHGDPESESLNSDLPGATPWPGMRHWVMESHYEYGSRVGVWHLLDEFATRRLPLTVFAVGMALERHPAVAHRMATDGHEVAAHGWRWIDYRDLPPEVEREHITRTLDTIERLTGTRPVGWYTGRISENTRRLAAETPGILYDSDAYNDDLPYWVEVEGKPHLVVPYAFDTNDMRFASAPGFNSSSDYFCYLRDTFDYLYERGGRHPRMMSVGLHCRLAGRPGRMQALKRFLDHVQQRPKVWICRRVDIANHWRLRHPPGSERS
jgi:allantoinase